MAAGRGFIDIGKILRLDLGQGTQVFVLLFRTFF